MDIAAFREKATYPQIKNYVLENTGLKVSSLYISQIKRKCGLDVSDSYNKVSSVTWGEFDEDESKTCTNPSQWNERTQIRQGDFLFSRANTLQLVGNCVIVKNVARRVMLSDKILRFVFDDSMVPDFVLQYTRTDMYRKQIETLASGNQDGMRNVSQKNMRLVEFPVPSLPEQREIVRILDSLLSKEQQAHDAALAVLDRIDEMKKAILAKAFRGQLGTNDPSEAPFQQDELN